MTNVELTENLEARPPQTEPWRPAPSPANAVGIDHRMSAVLGFTAALRVTTGDVPGLATKSK
jgi:hypothetical protein